MRLVPSPSHPSRGRRVRAVLLSGLVALGLAAPVSAQVSLTTAGATYSENFDSLANTAGSINNTALPTGWALAESGTSTRNNGQYAADTGSGNAGDTYSYGSAGSTERAFGGLRSGTLVPTFGASFVNSTGATITSLAIAYTGEQWRLGTVGRTDRINFEYSLDATDLTTGTWTGVAALNFTSPFTTTAGAVVGNAAGNRTNLSATITGLSIPNGATFRIRWTDLDAASADDGLAVDDFSLTPLGAGGTVTPTLTVNDVARAEGNAGTTTFTFTVSLSAAAGAGGVTFDIATADGTATTAGNDYAARALTSQTIPAGSTTYTFDVQVNGDASVEPNETFFVNVTNVTGANVADGQGQGTIQNDDVALTSIHDIQGAGTSSPLAGQVVTTRGVVIGLKSNGYFIQTPDAEADADPATSEGIFVFTSSAPIATVGALVQITGTVTEFVPTSTPTLLSITELTSPTALLLSSGNALPTVTTLGAADFSTATSLERYEGMLVTVPSLTVTQPTDGNISEAQATATTTGVFYAVRTGTARPFREAGLEPFAVTPAGAPANVPRFDGNFERLRVDSDAIAGNPALNVATGAVITNLTGVIDSAGGWYTLLPTNSASAGVTGGAGVASVPTPASGEATVGSINLERFFDTINDSNGAVTLNSTAYDRRLAKASATIRNVMKTPDIVAVVEMELLRTLGDLSTRITNDALAAGNADPAYVPYLVQGNDIGGINVGFLVKSSVQVISLTQEGKAATYINPNTGVAETLNDRPPLVLETVLSPAGGTQLPLTVIVNHLRSLNGVDDETPAAVGTVGDRVRAKRKAQAEFLANLVQGRQASNPSERILLVGDFNAFEVNDGYVDVIGTIAGTPAPANQVVAASPDLVNPDLINLVRWVPPADRYSYVFEGNAQVLDHALITQNLSRLVSRITFARSNADQAETSRNDGTTPARISDHDGLVVGFATGTPMLAVDVVGSTPGGTEVTVRFRNVGSGNLFNLAVDSLRARVTSGTGTVAVTTTTPLTVAPVLGPGQSATVTVAVTSSPTVLRYAIAEGGSYQTATGAVLRFSSTQSVTK